MDLDMLDEFVKELRCKCGGPLAVRGIRDKRGLAFTKLHQCMKCQSVKKLRVDHLGKEESVR